MMGRKRLLRLIVCSLFIAGPLEASAQESLCATVKIEVVQELALERQAFDARMRIDNGLDTLGLENVDVDVWFTDDDGIPVPASSDPDDTTATFFIRVDSLEGISDVDGTGTVAPASDAVIRWLIIPNPGAAQDEPQGKRYQVGARLSYTLGGEPKTLEVVPDTIVVKPQPLLAIDYFLEEEVYADDAFTAETEPPEPFTLGVRIRNTGSGTARSVTIDSAQPQIISNETGLRVGFEILGSFVDDAEVQESLLLDFGDIEPDASRVGRWVMETSVSGVFTDFSAEFSHSDELGGELTSVIDGPIGAHLLVHDVRVDLPGRDSVGDFLADDGGVLRVYESGGVDTLVTDVSGATSLVPAGGTPEEPAYAFTVSSPGAMFFVKLSDPLDGAKEVLRVVRSDGKILPARNGWNSRTRDETVKTDFHHFLNVFDVGADTGTYTYTLTLTDPTLGPLPPVLDFVADRTALEGETVSFAVSASDPDGTFPALSVDALPVGATFVDHGDGTGTFDWPTLAGQAGSYPLVFRASDGVYQDTQIATVRIFTLEDTDGDGMKDTWEMEHFGDLSRDGTGDADGDGMSDYQEYLAGSDPNDGSDVPVRAGVGDLDGDGDIDVADVLAMLRFVGDGVGSVTLEDGDLAPLGATGDGRIDVGDAVVLMRLVNGELKQVPEEP